MIMREGSNSPFGPSAWLVDGNVLFGISTSTGLMHVAEVPHGAAPAHPILDLDILVTGSAFAGFIKVMKLECLV